VIALHDAGGRGEELIQAWAGEAKRRGVILFCPTYEEPRGDAPFDHDKRLLKLKQEIQNQYEIDAKRILVAGSGIGGHYAFYLGLRYPKEFSAVASIGNAVTGTLEKWFTYSYAEVNQLPVLILVDREQEEPVSSETQSELEEIQSRGYVIQTVQTDDSSLLHNPSAHSYIMDWFESMSLQRQAEFQKHSFRLKERVFEWVDNLFQNR
jgi:predicted peptidase